VDKYVQYLLSIAQPLHPQQPGQDLTRAFTKKICRVDNSTNFDYLSSQIGMCCCRWIFSNIEVSSHSARSSVSGPLLVHTSQSIPTNTLTACWYGYLDLPNDLASLRFLLRVGSRASTHRFPTQSPVCR
jgi:hypothetical protein